MEMQSLFQGERFPNVVVATDGTVLATWGAKSVRVRRSEDGGKTWGPPVTIAEPGFHGGGVIVDETSGDILVFVHDKHPPAPTHLWRSKDHGKTWKEENLKIAEDVNGNIPQMHMAEHGITLRHGEHKGRLLRPARVYGKNNEYNTAIFSDDGGKTWQPSKPFPMKGTGEGAVAELSNGHIYYSSRQHRFEKVADFTHRRAFAWSRDGGETWQEAGHDSVLPDGPRYRGDQRRGANFNGHFGMMCGLTCLPVEDRDILIYSNADTPDHERKRMTVWASFDGGRSWPVKRLVHEGAGAYSSLTAGRPGTSSAGWIFLQFESGGVARMARFNLAWLLGGEKTGNGEAPQWVKAAPTAAAADKPSADAAPAKAGQRPVAAVETAGDPEVIKKGNQQEKERKK
ncbi:MAG: sialidase family protein [Kiritimatiellaeota bacterium]|nr:sialidase family protein [Kiritimatiellota bacterium]